MAEVSLYLTNMNVSVAQGMDTGKSADVVKEFENVELGDVGGKQAKIPRRTIYFASGETMEEYSTDEDEEEEEQRNALTCVDKSKLTWAPYVWFQMWRVTTSTISVCDYLGEKMASLLGITTPKYQYAIDEYNRMRKEEEEEEEENRLSEEAELRFDGQRSQESQQPNPEQTETTAAFVNVTFDLEQESHTTSDASKASALIPS